MEDNNLITLAKKYARDFHREHQRASGENYYNHAQKVVLNLRKIHIEEPTIVAAAMLHHVLNFNPQKEQEILDIFGPDVIGIIKDYRFLEKAEVLSEDTAEINNEFLIQTYLNLAKNPKVLFLRIADKVESIGTALSLPYKKAIESANKAIYIYAPICRLLGLSEFLRILEDNALKILNPADYFVISHYFSSRKKYFLEVEKDVSSVIRDILNETGIHFVLKYRIKSIYSTYLKIFRKGLEITNENIGMLADLIAMRILVDSVEYCYKVEDILKQLFDDIPELRDDYIKNPKINGYQSIHDTFKITKNLAIEIQIRTFEMHEDNEFGQYSHALYKMGQKVANIVKENPNILKDLNYFVGNSIKVDHFKNKVYALSPKGKIVELPRGSNLIDFAYSIHEDLGNGCIGGLVNGVQKKLNYIINDGDVIEIRTSGNKRIPSSDWIDIVKSRKARAFIRKALRNV